MKRWPTKPLGEVCSINPKLAKSEAPRPDSEVTFVPMAAIDEVSGTISRPERRRYSEVAKGYTPFTVNDVLFAKITPCMQNGKAAVASDLCGGFGFGSTEFHVLRSAGSVLPQWVFAFIRQPAFRSAAEASFTGSAGQQRVPANFLKTFPIPVPPLPEQERIVRILGEAEELRKLRAQADRRTADLSPALFHEMFGDPRGSSKGCQIEKLGAVTTFITSGSRGWARYYSETGARFIRVQNLEGHHLSFEDVAHVNPPDTAETRRTRVQSNDLLLAITGNTIGLSALAPDDVGEAYVSQHVAIIRLNQHVVSPYVASFMALPTGGQHQIAQMQYGHTKPGISLQQIREMNMPLPPLTLQKEFAARVSEIRAVQAEQAASGRRLDDLFQSLLHRAFREGLRMRPAAIVPC